MAMERDKPGTFDQHRWDERTIPTVPWQKANVGKPERQREPTAAERSRGIMPPPKAR